MTFQFSRNGRDAELRASLPFNNALVMRFQVNPLAEDAVKAFEISRNTHLWLLFQAASLVESQGAAGRQIHDLIKPWHGKLQDDFHDGLCQGLWDADKKAPYNNPDPYIELMPTWTSHFYDPDSGTNWVGQRTPTALSEGCKFYRKSQRAYRKEDWSKVGYNLGLAVHYLSDLTQPMHAANFTWLDSKDFGYHTDFERYVKDKLHRVQPPHRYKPCLEESAYKAFFHAAARYSKDCYYALLCRSEWTQHYSRAAWDESVWEARVGALIPHILGDAIQIIAQFLLMWWEGTAAGEF